MARRPGTTTPLLAPLSAQTTTPPLPSSPRTFPLAEPHLPKRRQHQETRSGIVGSLHIRLSFPMIHTPRSPQMASLHLKRSPLLQSVLVWMRTRPGGTSILVIHSSCPLLVPMTPYLAGRPCSPNAKAQHHLHSMWSRGFRHLHRPPRQYRDLPPTLPPRSHPSQYRPRWLSSNKSQSLKRPPPPSA